MMNETCLIKIERLLKSYLNLNETIRNKIKADDQLTPYGFLCLCKQGSKDMLRGLGFNETSVEILTRLNLTLDKVKKLEVDDEQVELILELFGLNAVEPLPKRPRVAAVCQTASEFLKAQTRGLEAGHWINTLSQDTPLTYIEDWLSSNLSQPLLISPSIFEKAIQEESLAENETFKNNIVRGEDVEVDNRLQAIILQAVIGQFQFSEASEISNICFYDSIFRQWIDLFSSSYLKIKQSRDSIDRTSNSSTTSLRPDYLLYIDGKLILKGEEKTRTNGGIQAARDDLKDKRWLMEEEFYGKIPWLFGYAACESKFELYGFSRSSTHFGQSVHLFTFDLSDPAQRVKLLIVAVKMLLLVRKYTKLTEESLVFPFPQMSWTGLEREWTGNDNRFYFAANGVCKYISKLPDGVEFDSWKKIYSFLNESGRHAEGKTNVIRRVASKTDKFTSLPLTIKMVPFCYRRRRIDVVSEFVRCLQHVTNGLGFLHHNKIQHRDLRWSNILHDHCKDSYIIIDLEHGAMLDDQSEYSVVGAKFRRNLPTEYMTPVDDSLGTYRFTMATDVCSLGLMAYEALKRPVQSLGHLLVINVYDKTSNTTSLERRILDLVLKRTLHEEEDKRPTAQQLYLLLGHVLKMIQAVENAKDDVMAAVIQLSSPKLEDQDVPGLIAELDKISKDF